jgi:hypothetical protein
MNIPARIHDAEQRRTRNFNDDTWGDPTGWGRRRGTLAGVVVGWLRPTFAILTLLAYKDLTKGCAFSGQRPAFFGQPFMWICALDNIGGA